MRRRIIVLLLMLLPLQLVWSAAAAYCSHETMSAVHHFGHHVHVHKAAKSDDGAASKADSSVPDNDCPVCHLGGPSLPPDVAVFACVQAPPPLRAAGSAPYSSAFDRVPERPNWSLAV